MRLSVKQVQQVQLRLNMLGYGPLTLDGVFGPKTNKEIYSFEQDALPVFHKDIKEETWDSLFKEVPWMGEALKIYGLDENIDKEQLSAWLMSDKEYLGDPSENPWCGDFVSTALNKAEVKTPQPEKPFLAASWAKWGYPCEPRYGAVMSLWRESLSSWKGHVGFYVGEDDHYYHLLGGNQHDSVSIASFTKDRLRNEGSRWPTEDHMKNKIDPSLFAFLDTDSPLSTDES